MLVKFLKDYGAWKKGETTKILDNYCTYDLIPRGIVQPYKEAEPKKKHTEAAPVDKMVKGAETTKDE